MVTIRHLGCRLHRPRWHASRTPEIGHVFSLILANPLRPQEKLIQIPDHPLIRRNRDHFKDVMEMPEGSNRKCERGFTTAFAFDQYFLTRPDNLHRWRYRKALRARFHLHGRHAGNRCQRQSALSQSAPSRPRSSTDVLLVVRKLIADLPIDTFVHHKSFKGGFLVSGQCPVSPNPCRQGIRCRHKIIKVVPVELPHQAGEYFLQFCVAFLCCFVQHGGKSTLGTRSQT